MGVEKGDFCIRGNPNNVDINRNWDFYWGKSIETGEENPGPKPFSELETYFIKESIRNFKPKLFLTIHSGEFSLFHPYAYSDEKTNNNIGILLNLEYILAQDILAYSLLFILYKSFFLNLLNTFNESTN